MPMRHARVFNLNREDLLSKVVGPWLENRVIEMGEREWLPEESSLKILDGPQMDPPDLSYGQGWSNAERKSEDVTLQMLQDAPAPRRNPAPHVQPRAASARITPPETIANIILCMRSSDRSSSSAVIARVPHQLPHELDEPGCDSEEQKNDIEEFLVQEPSNSVPDHGADRQHERERCIFAHHHRDRSFSPPHETSLAGCRLGCLANQQAQHRV